MRGPRPMHCQAVPGQRRSVVSGAVFSKPEPPVRLNCIRCSRAALHQGRRARRRVACVSCAWHSLGTWSHCRLC